MALLLRALAAGAVLAVVLADEVSFPLSSSDEDLTTRGSDKPASCPDPGDFCVDLVNCPQLANLTRKGYKPSKDDIGTLKKAHCGFNGTQPLVCCHFEGESYQSFLLNYQPGSGSPFAPLGAPFQVYQPGFSVAFQPARPMSNRPMAPPPRPPSMPMPVPDRAQQLSLLPLETCGASNEDRLIGGNDTKIMEFPWMARIGYGSPGSGEYTYNCGGSLINERHVLTAAHCINPNMGLVPVSVRLGEHDSESEMDCSIIFGKQVCAPPVVDIDVEAIIRHESYVDGETAPAEVKFQNDVALLRLARPVRFTTAVAPICLPVGSDTMERTLTGKKVTVAGWGRTANGPLATGSRLLQKVNIPVARGEDCTAAYRQLSLNVVPEMQLCAGGEREADSCSGDSGGPLTYIGNIEGSVRTVQYGVVSFGLSHCATPGTPGVYTRVSHYLPWILSKLRP